MIFELLALSGLILLVGAFIAIDYKMLGNPAADRVKSIIKKLAKLTVYFCLGGGLLYLYAPKTIEDIRVATSGVETVGTVVSSVPFRARRGATGNRHWVEGFKVTIEITDRRLGRVSNTFEFPRRMAQGTQHPLYHVPNTRIASLRNEVDFLKIAISLFGLGCVIAGIVNFWDFITKRNGMTKRHNREEAHMDVNEQTSRISLHPAVWLVPSALLLLALLPLPYGFYTPLRLVVCGATLLLAYQEYQLHNQVSGWVVVCVALGLIFNPIIPVHLTRELWGGVSNVRLG